MTSDKQNALIDAIKSDDSETIVELLEPRIGEETTTDAEILLCGVTLLMPPLVDEEAASRVFSSMYSGGRARVFEAAVWDAYRFGIMRPDGDESFENILQRYPNSAVAAYILSLVMSMRDNHSASLALNRRSIELRPFPFNLISALYNDPGLTSENRIVMWQMVCDLVADRSIETHEEVCTVEGALQLQWDNLITGTRIVSELWDEYRDAFEKM